MTLARIIGALIPESPARTAGEQLALSIATHRMIDQLPETDPDPDPAPTDRED